jgi:adenine-specific DNA-methyltransferase
MMEIEADQIGGQNLRRLKRLLAELFTFDQADLDFGIYRVMNLRREEIRRFLDEDLLPQVRETLGVVAAGERDAIEAELSALEKKLRDDGIDPQSSRRFRELQARYEAQPDMASAEEDVYSHLVTFFRRYYREGDFISLRRYKEGVYAIPYEGEEVKLHWANADQYYVKSSEHFRDYTFLLADGRRVHFKLVEASTEINNNRAQSNDRRFILTDEEPVAKQDGELVIRFEYRPDPDGRRRDEVNAETVERVLADPAAAGWNAALGRDVRPDGAREPLTLLRKHLNTYTAKNEFDYFIHKDLGGFLRRELDFYLKNEVMHLDDIDQSGKSLPDVERYLDKLRAIRRVGHKIIDFLAQLEDFQKRLWLKKKFVIETHWCVTLDRVPEELYEEIAANDRQREEWVRLFAIDEIAGDMVTPSYSEPLDVNFLRANPYLVVDTSLFDGTFADRLLATIDNLDENTDGLLVHSENFQGLALTEKLLHDEIDCIYIDPPYNTDGSPIAYKNGYRESSWISLIDERVRQGSRLLKKDGVLCVTIDDYQHSELVQVLEDVFTKDHVLGTVVIRANPSGRITRNGLAETHEYALFAGRSDEAALRRLKRSEEQARRFKGSDEAGVFEWRNFRREGSSSERQARPRRYFPLYCRGSDVRVPALEWNEANRSYLVLEEPETGEAICYPHDTAGTERVWRWGLERVTENADELEARIDSQGNLQVYYKYRASQEGVLAPSIWSDAKYSATEHGTGTLKKLFGERNIFSFPKSVYATADCIWIGGLEDDAGTVLDYFAGSGTTAHSVINLNREDGGQRKYILVEMGEYFDSVLKPRIIKAIYSNDWDNGKPVSREGISQLIKVIRLESYEDALNNLEVRRTEQQQSLLSAHDGLREEYMLRYWLDVETRGSASLLDIEQFDDPWSFALNVARGSAAETRPVTVDLVETFNYLIGLRVKHVDVIRGVAMVQGTLPSGEKTLVIWRKLADMSSEELDRFLFAQNINPRDMELDVIYVNGDNHLENTRRPDETWKVRLIEEEFLRLMFETADRA